MPSAYEVIGSLAGIGLIFWLASMAAKRFARPLAERKRRK